MPMISYGINEWEINGVWISRDYVLSSSAALMAPSNHYQAFSGLFDQPNWNTRNHTVKDNTRWHKYTHHINSEWILVYETHRPNWATWICVSCDMVILPLISTHCAKCRDFKIFTSYVLLYPSKVSVKLINISVLNLLPRRDNVHICLRFSLHIYSVY